MTVALGDAHTPLTKMVKDALRQRILNAEFETGARLVEGRISEEMGVSRMPVREALRELAAEGLVKIIPRRGATVSMPAPDQKMELIEVRATLESLNAKLAAKRKDPERIAELQRVLAAGENAIEEGDFSQISAHNDAFHTALGQVSGNATLQDLIRTLRDQTAMLFKQDDPVKVSKSWQEHADILRAVIAGDEELAALLAARHVYNSVDTPEATDEV
ncbi:MULTISPECIES: FCD domain-containing protein [Roseobacteraceae]|uniref:GntR family transcriptional regulator n=1 Tax=Celeribacter baekdonensis B30 TaxID=1208323 RepID=K2J7V7_9RHOB|nr:MULTISPECIES: FCD domain-containing protein [Roseobacteraceae]EKE71258.1 GntR family transcriptional regulator [Celeribacter baekdonensis B30]KAB6716980.1 GntR family transcriptional regulator [Roseobacter sp. TSBP12]